MQDLRALANTSNLNSYRAWQREGFRRSVFATMSVLVPMLTIPFIFAVTARPDPAIGVRAWVMAAAAALAVYLLVVAGLMAFAVLRLRAWKRANPWSPPARRVW